MDKIHFSSKAHEWETPQAFYDQLNREFGFTLDPCATKENAKCPKYYTKEQDGLRQNWFNETIFMNPPYGREISKWLAHACQTVNVGSQPIVCLLPCRTDTKWWHEWVMQASEIRFIKGRLKFGEAKNSAPFPSCVVIFRHIFDDNTICINVPVCSSISID